MQDIMTNLQYPLAAGQTNVEKLFMRPLGLTDVVVVGAWQTSSDLWICRVAAAASELSLFD